MYSADRGRVGEKCVSHLLLDSKGGTIRLYYIGQESRLVTHYRFYIVWFKLAQQIGS